MTARPSSLPATTINAELAEPAEKTGFCSASSAVSAVSALNVVPCGGYSDTLLTARGETPASHRGRRGAPLTRRDDRSAGPPPCVLCTVGAISGIFEGGATQSAAGAPAARFSARWGGAGMHRRPNAAGVSPRAVNAQQSSSTGRASHPIVPRSPGDAGARPRGASVPIARRSRAHAGRCARRRRFP